MQPLGSRFREPGLRPVSLSASLSSSLGFRLGTDPHTVTVYNRTTSKVLIYLYYDGYSTVSEWGQYKV